MKILVFGKHGYVSTSFQNYMKKFPDIQVDAASARDGKWKGIDYSQYDAVFNASGLAHANAKQGSEEEYIEVNGKLPVEIAKVAKKAGVHTYINMSSNIVYGDMSQVGHPKLISSKTIPTPDGIYGRSKLVAEEGLRSLEDENFHVAIIRSPLIYGDIMEGNFPLLVKFALKSPICPDIDNSQSMIYIDNLCELVHLIAINERGGLYLPQDHQIIHTKKLIADIAKAGHHKIRFTKAFNGLLTAMSPKIRPVRKAFGSLEADIRESGYFEWKYIIVGYDEAIHRIVFKMH